MEHNLEWAAGLTKLIGQRVALYRKHATDERGRPLTAQGLAERCSELGLKIERPAIAKLENGHRQSITVAEVLVLAAALDAAPVELLFPVLAAETMEPLPGQQADPWDAYRWFIGGVQPMATREMDPSSPIALRADHDGLAGNVAHWQRRIAAARASAAAAEQEGDSGMAQAQHYMADGLAEHELEQDVKSLQRVRDRMRDLGMILPSLDPAMALLLGEED